MGNCKNCGGETKKKNVYCSLTCRNIYVNKNLRDYSKFKQTMKLKKEKNLNEYLQDPKRCIFCENIISYEKKDNNYCGSSCMAKHTNTFKKGLKHNFTDENKKKILEIAKQNFSKSKTRLNKEIEVNEYYKNPKRCLNCDKIIEFNKRKNNNCSFKCKKEFYIKNKEDYQVYYELSKFKFNLKDFNDEFDFSLIEKYGWYKAKNNGDNVDGVSRDHMFSVKEGFRRLINPLLLAHPANCELIINRQNQSKCDSCSLTIEKLLEKISIFENKYGKYYDIEIKVYVELEEIKQMVS